MIKLVANVFVVVALSSCVMPAPQPVGINTIPMRPSQPAVDVQDGSRWYDKGYTLGMEDGTSRRSQNWRRHAGSLHDNLYQSQFSQGYDAGYQAGISEIERLDNRDAALARRYSSGYDAGESDRRRRIPADPDRYGVDDDRYGTWNSGYSDGYSGLPRRN